MARDRNVAMVNFDLCAFNPARTMQPHPQPPSACSRLCMYSKGLRSEMLRSHAVASHIVIIGVYIFFVSSFLDLSKLRWYIRRFKKAALL